MRYSRKHNAAPRVNDEPSTQQMELATLSSESSKIRSKQKFQVLIVQNKQSDMGLDINSFKSQINPADTGPGISGIKESNGKVIVKCASEECLENIKINLEKTIGKKYKIEKPKELNPRIKIFDVELGQNITDDQLCESIIRLNSLNSLGSSIFKIIKKKPY